MPTHPGSSAMYVYVDDHFPLIIAKLSGALTDADFAAMEASIQRTVARNARYVSIYLARESERPTSAARKRLAEIATISKDQNKLCVANAIVFGNPLVAGALKAIRWIRPADYPERTCTSSLDALAWVSEMARAAGLVLPEAGGQTMLRLDATVRDPAIAS